MSVGFWRERRVLVTGGAGFVGSHVTELLVHHGARVTVTSRKAAPPALHDVRSLASRADHIASDAQRVTTHIRQGRGTVGALLMDEEVYDDLQELVRDLKHNPWKFFWRE